MEILLWLFLTAVENCLDSNLQSAHQKYAQWLFYARNFNVIIDHASEKLKLYKNSFANLIK